ncbi:hypothetical protein MTYM_01623 [Methylococcales bacterium]|nr:hypothetical protein MTYM_01623 [Methylococcales bacterium]
MDYCFFTPSYIGDIERVYLLRESIRHFVKESLPHYLIVPKQDYQTFRDKFSLDKNVIILKQNDYVADYFYSTFLYRLLNRIAPQQSWRLHTQSGRPGWIVQQIVKLSLPDIIDEDAAFIIDSDVFFIRPFSIHEIVSQSPDERILMRRQSTDQRLIHEKHIQRSREILGLETGTAEFNYMSWPAIFYKDWVKNLQSYLEKKNDCHWQYTLFEANTISEYSIYGVYIDEVAKFKNCKIIATPLHQGIWSYEDFIDFINRKTSYGADKVCIVIQSNLDISVEQYKKHFYSFLNKSGSEEPCNLESQ